MKKIILIIFLTIAAINLIAQNKKANVDSSFANIFPVDILTKIELNASLVAAPIFFENNIYTTETSGLISCFNSTGKSVWKSLISGKVASNSVIVDSQFVAGSCNGEVISINAITGKQVQSIGIDDSITTGLAAFNYKGEKDLFLPKQSGSKTAIIFGTKSGEIYCLDLETLQEYWRNNDSRGSVSSSPVIIENKVLFSGSDGYLYSIDARNGLLNWRWKETAETDFSNAGIICDGKKIFLVSKDFQLYCIDLLLGKLIWKTDNVKTFPAIGLSNNKKDLLVKTFDKRLLIISVDKGTILKQIKHNDEFNTKFIPSIESDGKIFFTNKNVIFMLDKKFKEEVIMEFGDESIESFQLIGDKIFLVSTSTGTILIYKPRK